MEKDNKTLDRIKKSLSEIESHLSSDNKKGEGVKNAVGDITEKGHDLIDRAEKGASDLTDKVVEKTDKLIEKKEACCGDHAEGANKSMLKYILAGFVALIAVLSFKKSRKKNK